MTTDAQPPSQSPPTSQVSPEVIGSRTAALLVLISSGAVLVIELVSLRLLAPYVGLTLQMSTTVIGVALAAIALGAWIGGRLADAYTPRYLVGPLFLAGGALTLATSPIVRGAGEWVGVGMSSQLLSLASVAIFAPAAALSAVSPVVVKLRLTNLSETGSIVGLLSSVGTLGGIAATFGTGFVLIALLSVTAILTSLGLFLLMVGVALTATLCGKKLRGLTAGLLALALLGTVATVLIPQACDVETSYHCARVVTDPARSSGRFLELDTQQHSYTDLDDPTYLRFSYIRAIASVLDTFRPPGAAIRTLHLGAGGVTVPRYLAKRRPGSSSSVVEIDPGVLEVARNKLGFRDDHSVGNGITTHVADARVFTAKQPAGRYDAVVGDAFGSVSVPWQLTTREFARQIRRVLTGEGVYVLNMIDNPPLKFLRAELATMSQVFSHVLLVAPVAQLNRSSGGNFVIVASAQPLPRAELVRRLAQWSPQLGIATTDQLRDLTRDATAPVLTDEYAPVDQLLSNS